jgi:hypothetical protein
MNVHRIKFTRESERVEWRGPGIWFVSNLVEGTNLWTVPDLRGFCESTGKLASLAEVEARVGAFLASLRIQVAA